MADAVNIPSDHLPGSKRDALLTGCGFGLFVLFLAELAMGVFLEFSYRASAADAYQSVNAMQAGGLAIFRGFHYWASTLLIVGSGAMLVALAIRDLPHRSKTWIGMVLLLLSSLLSQISGNLLPFDRHGVQTAVVEASVARQIPLAGDLATKAILGGDQFGVQTLSLWHIAHIAFFVLGLAGFGVFWRSLRGKTFPKAALWTPIVLAALLALMVKAPLGQSATGVDFTSYDARVSWYTWPMHASLNLFLRISPTLGWVGSVVIPSLLAALLVLAPWLVRRFSLRVVQRVLLGFGVYFLVAILLVGGGFAPLTGNRDPTEPGSGNPAPVGPGDPALIAKGRELFNSLPCVSCHGQDGKKAVSGPSLSGVANRQGGDPNWYMRFIKNPAATKANSVMPAFPNLTNDQLRAIAEFLIHQQP